jgi:hypothetical protein
MAVTAGIDSRTLLAASRDLADSIHYFVNLNTQLADDHPDIAIPRRLFRAIDRPFHVYRIEDFKGAIDDEFRDAYLDNTYLASDRRLPVVYHVYHKQHRGKLNVCGVGEIGRSRFGSASRKVTPYLLAYRYGYRRSRYAVIQAGKWLRSSLDTATRCGVNPLTLFYWEQDLGNWGAVGNSESDIAIEEFNPYNSHYLFELFLSVDKRYTRYDDCILFKEIIRTMWPELLRFPINPPHDFRTTVASRLKALHLYGLYDAIRYGIYRTLFGTLRTLPTAPLR